MFIQHHGPWSGQHLLSGLSSRLARRCLCESSSFHSSTYTIAPPTYNHKKVPKKSQSTPYCAWSWGSSDVKWIHLSERSRERRAQRVHTRSSWGNRQIQVLLLNIDSLSTPTLLSPILSPPLVLSVCFQGLVSIWIFESASKARGGGRWGILPLL